MTKDAMKAIQGAELARHRMRLAVMNGATDKQIAKALLALAAAATEAATVVAGGATR